MAGRPCKVCELKKTHSEAYKLISTEIKKEKGKAKIKQLLFILKERFNLKVNGVNIHRHKEHLAKNSGKVVKTKKKQPAEMEVYSPEGELLYTNIQEIIDDLTDSEGAFCEFFVNTHNHNGTSSYMQAFQTDVYSTAAVNASKLLKKTNIQLYISHLINERSRNLKVSSSFVLTGLMENYSRCMQSEPVIGKDGEPIGIYKHDSNAANKALELIGKSIQMWEKKPDPTNQKLFQEIMEKLLINKINPITAGIELEKNNIGLPEVVKIAMRKVDPSVLDKPDMTDSDDMKEYTDEELEQVLSGDVN
jgi:hypothetical protein